MKCFYRNETLHQTDPIGIAQKRKTLIDKELKRGMAYATHELEGSNSLFQGSYDDYTPCPSRSHPDCGRAGGSCLWRLQPLNQSPVIQSKASSSVPNHSFLFLDGIELNQSSGREMGSSSFTSRAERFSIHRSGWRFFVAA